MVDRTIMMRLTVNKKCNELNPFQLSELLFIHCTSCEADLCDSGLATTAAFSELSILRSRRGYNLKRKTKKTSGFIKKHHFYHLNNLLLICMR